jgi:3-dehydroquinate synthase
MSAGERVRVGLGARSYDIVVGSGLLARAGQELAKVMPRADAIIVTDANLAATGHLEVLEQSLDAAAITRRTIVLPPGEATKSMARLGELLDHLLDLGAERSTTIVAFGGGVIGDLAGFAAAIALRGLDCIQIPTTLLAQVDSAIGGKVGVNHTLGKNLIGAFHAPRLVLADPTLLSTLPRREFRSGLYEVIKYGVIANPSLLDRVATTLPWLFDREADALSAIVTESCRIKAQVVTADEREAGVRRTLNFGHTVGHAIEAVTKYRRFRHGEAVAYGMLAALSLGTQRGVTPQDAYDTVARLIAMLGPLPPVADLSAKEILAAVRRDKKIVDGTLHFVIASQLGATSELKDVTETQLKTALQTIGVQRA